MQRDDDLKKYKEIMREYSEKVEAHLKKDTGLYNPTRLPPYSNLNKSPSM